MTNHKKRERTLTPNPYYIAKGHGKEREISQAGFESQVFEKLQKIRGYSNTQLEKFPVDMYGFFSLDDLDADCTIKIINRSFDQESIFRSPHKLRALYDDESSDIVILDDFKYRSCQGIALVALGVIRYEDMTGIITTIPNTDCSPIYLGPTVDIFTTLVLAGHISKLDATQEKL